MVRDVADVASPGSASPRPVPRWAAGWLGLVPVLGLMGGTMMCTCGHFGWDNLILGGVCGAFGWLWSLQGRVLLRAPLVIPPLLVVGKAVGDVLYYGHDHLLAAPPAFLLVEPTLAVIATLLLAYAGTVAAALAARRRDE